MRPPVLRLSLDELVVDSFAGGGGASTGIEAALGRPVDIAINRAHTRGVGEGYRAAVAGMTLDPLPSLPPKRSKREQAEIAIRRAGGGSK